MSLSNNCLKNSYRLTVIALAVTLTGCSLNPFSKDDEPRRSAPAATSSSSSGGASTSIEPTQRSAAAEPTYNQPALQRINEPVPLAQGHPNEYVVQVGDTLWNIAGSLDQLGTLANQGVTAAGKRIVNRAGQCKYLAALFGCESCCN